MIFAYQIVRDLSPFLLGAILIFLSDNNDNNMRHFLNNLILLVTKFFKDEFFGFSIFYITRQTWLDTRAIELAQKKEKRLSEQAKHKSCREKKERKTQNQLMREETELNNHTGLMSVNEVQDNVFVDVLSILYCIV